jgi:hypothetical protein
LPGRLYFRLQGGSALLQLRPQGGFLLRKPLLGPGLFRLFPGVQLIFRRHDFV